MSAIAGLIRFDGGPVEPDLIETMAQSMAHRGPDGIACWSRGPVALGQCMLRTTPEALEETQPLANEDESVVLVMDGRVDNWEELRAELVALGARLRTRADAELVLRAYERWGHDCVRHMDGDFALVIWDERRREAFCARDRMAHKPFHYHWNGKRLAIASELHAILALPWVEEEINEGLVAEHLARELRSLDETLWKGILRLPFAHRMLVNNGGPRVDRYWAPELDSELRYKHEEDFVEHYRALLEDAVRRHSRSQSPLACEVSGGLDSSAVFAVAEVLRRQGKLPAPGIEGYTLHIENDPGANDLEYARAVGAHIGRPLHEVPPTHKPLQWYCDWARGYRDLPTAPHGTILLGLFEAARERGSRVSLGGVGGDQWLGGDHTYFANSLAAGRLGEFLECLRRDTRTYGARRSFYLAARFGAVPLLPPALRQYGRQALARARGEREGNRDWLAGPLSEALAQRRSRRPCAEPDRQRPVHRQRLRDLLSGDLASAKELMDRLAASQGLEVRSPLNSAPMIQFGFSVPQHWLIREGWDRHLHRKAVTGILPETVTWRRGKAHFMLVFERHRAELKQTLDRLVADAPGPWVSPDGLARLWQEAEAERPGNIMLLWMLFACDAVRRAGRIG